jgi:hypothetical protein
MTEKLASRIVKIGQGVDDILASSSKERHKASLSGVPTKIVNKFIDRFGLTRKDLSSALGRCHVKR